MTDDTSPAKNLRLTTSDGISLEAEVALPRHITAAVVLAHPHPLHGGSMRSLVTSELFRTLPQRNIAVLRFNFRGVGNSTGQHGAGVDERFDIAAGIDALAACAPGIPLLIGGWSFGADIALTVIDPRLAGWFLIAPPIRVVPIETMLAAHDARPKRLVIPEHDEFRLPESARAITADWTATSLVVVPGADHYFAGRTARVADLLVEFAENLNPPSN